MAATKTDPTPAIRLQRTFTAPREKVFRAWTSREALMRWWASPEYETTSIRIDLRAGGSYDFAMRKLPDGEVFHLLGTFKEVKPPEKVVYTWTWSLRPEMGDTVVTVEFNDLGGSTEVVLTHERIQDEDLRKDHTTGWGACFDRVAEYLSAK